MLVQGVNVVADDVHCDVCAQRLRRRRPQPPASCASRSTNTLYDSAFVCVGFSLIMCCH
jgi:hypothetical protein